MTDVVHVLFCIPCLCVLSVLVGLSIYECELLEVASDSRSRSCWVPGSQQYQWAWCSTAWYTEWHAHLSPVRSCMQRSCYKPIFTVYGCCCC